MVVALCILDEIVGGIVNSGVEGSWLAEVKRTAEDWQNFAGSHVSRVGGGELVRIDIENHVCARFRRVTIEIEVTVVGHVYDGLFVSRCFKLDVQRVVAQHCICGCSLHGTGESVVAVG